jgi:hypothetical protein
MVAVASSKLCLNLALMVAVASSKLCLNLALMVAVGSLRQPLAEADKWRQGVVVEE